MTLPASTRISARLKRVQENCSPGNLCVWHAGHSLDAPRGVSGSALVYVTLPLQEEGSRTPAGEISIFVEFVVETWKMELLFVLHGLKK